jgi:MFS family permease
LLRDLWLFLLHLSNIFRHTETIKKYEIEKNYMWIIVGIVMLNSIGYSVVLPLLPFLVGKYLPSQQVVVGMSALMSVFAAYIFFAAPVFGALSDRYGRKTFLSSLLGSVIGYVLFGIGVLWVLFLGRIIDGLTAGNISTLYAYQTALNPRNGRNGLAISELLWELEKLEALHWADY